MGGTCAQQLKRQQFTSLRLAGDLMSGETAGYQAEDPMDKPVGVSIFREKFGYRLLMSKWLRPYRAPGDIATFVGRNGSPVHLGRPIDGPRTLNRA
jgi:hypothetical protein